MILFPPSSRPPGPFWLTFSFFRFILYVSFQFCFVPFHSPKCFTLFHTTPNTSRFLVCPPLHITICSSSPHSHPIPQITVLFSPPVRFRFVPWCPYGHGGPFGRSDPDPFSGVLVLSPHHLRFLRSFGEFSRPFPFFFFISPRSCIPYIPRCTTRLADPWFAVCSPVFFTFPHHQALFLLTLLYVCGPYVFHSRKTFRFLLPHYFPKPTSLLAASISFPPLVKPAPCLLPWLTPRLRGFYAPPRLYSIFPSFIPRSSRILTPPPHKPHPDYRFAMSTVALYPLRLGPYIYIFR